jgi:hypothetical protein
MANGVSKNPSFILENVNLISVKLHPKNFSEKIFLPSEKLVRSQKNCFLRQNFFGVHFWARTVQYTSSYETKSVGLRNADDKFSILHIL